MVFEHRTEPIAPPARYVVRVLRRTGMAGTIVFLSLGIGTIGYHATEGMPWVDALLNASMILTGMGPVNPLQTTGGKVFATAYALFSGIVFLTTTALVFGPVIHRLLHRFHLQAMDEERENRRGDRKED